MCFGSILPFQSCKFKNQILVYKSFTYYIIKNEDIYGKLKNDGSMIDYVYGPEPTKIWWRNLWTAPYQDKHLYSYHVIRNYTKEFWFLRKLFMFCFWVWVHGLNLLPHSIKAKLSMRCRSKICPILASIPFLMKTTGAWVTIFSKNPYLSSCPWRVYKNPNIKF